MSVLVATCGVGGERATIPLPRCKGGPDFEWHTLSLPAAMRDMAEGLVMSRTYRKWQYNLEFSFLKKWGGKLPSESFKIARF